MRVSNTLTKVINGILEPLNVSIVRRQELLQLREKASFSLHFETGVKVILRCFPENAQRSLNLLWKARGQLFQDIFVLNCLDFKFGGFFVEFGATDGKRLSNTWLLEKDFGWQGILAEPARSWRSALEQERTCAISTDCVWKVSGDKLRFTETSVGEFSTLAAFSDSDMHAKLRADGKTYEVATISLNDLLANYNAPYQIDYLSIDTEGSEFEILQAFDFTRHKFKILTVEHNFTEQRGKIRDLLQAHGYVQILEDISCFDDWYVDAAIASRFDGRFSIA